MDAPRQLARLSVSTKINIPLILKFPVRSERASNLSALHTSDGLAGHMGVYVHTVSARI